MKCMLTCVQTVTVLILLTAPAQAAVIQVPSGGNLQAALTQAQPGDTVLLEAGVTYPVADLVLPLKPAGPDITVRTNAALPERRITQADLPLLARLQSTVHAPVLTAGAGVSGWRFVGIDFVVASTWGTGEAIAIQDAQHLTFDRIRIQAPSAGLRRGIRLNGRHLAVERSRIAGMFEWGRDSQALAAWDGAAFLTIRDNYLEAASENIMFGGTDSRSPDRIPSDILIEGNLFTKPLAWKAEGSIGRVVKNLFELKAARRVHVRHNVFERNWVDGQGGTAIVFTPRNQDGAAPWSVIDDVLFEYNIVRDTVSHFNILGYDNIAPSQQTTNITVRHNLLLGTGGRMATIGNEIGTLVFDHNTYINPSGAEVSMVSLYAEGSIATAGGQRTAQFAVNHFTFRNSMLQGNTYGLHSSVGFGTAALTAMTRGYQWTNNVIAGGWGTYPALTTFVTTDQYPSQFDASYYLALTSPFKFVATDGTDIGWNRPDGTTRPPVAITTVSLPGGRTATAYAASLTAQGGSGTFAWSLASGALPAGLSLHPQTGTISGMPLSAGTSTFTVRAADAADATNTTTAVYTISVVATVTITTAAVPDGKVTTAYAAALGAVGGTGRFKWRLAAGALPPGLALDVDTGVIAGTPQTVCTNSFTVVAADAIDVLNTASATFTMRVSAGVAGVTITTSSLPSGRASVGYTASVSTSGGSGVVAWTVTAGALPAGLTLDAGSGTISGTPTAAGNSTFTLRACDATDVLNCAVASYTLAVSAPVSIVTAGLPTPVRGQAYAVTLAVANAVGQVSWKVSSGALPSGLSLNEATGVISGIPTNNSSATVVVTAKDSTTSASRTYTMKVSNK